MDYNSRRAQRAPALTAAPGAEVGTGHRPQLPPPGPPSGPGTDPGERRDGRGGRDRAHCQAPGQDGGQEERGECRRQGPRSPVGVGAAPYLGSCLADAPPTLSAASPPRCRAAGPHLCLSARCEGPPPPQIPFLGPLCQCAPLITSCWSRCSPHSSGVLSPRPIALSLPHPLRRCGIHPLPFLGRAPLCAPISAPCATCPLSPPAQHPQPFSPVPLEPFGRGVPTSLELPFALGKTPVLMDLLPASPSHSSLLSPVAAGVWRAGQAAVCTRGVSQGVL